MTPQILKDLVYYFISLLVFYGYCMYKAGWYKGQQIAADEKKLIQVEERIKVLEERSQ